MSFRHYLEEEDDKPYYTKNSLAYYYEDMQVKEKIIKDMAKYIAGYDDTLKNKTDAIEQQVAERLAAWDQKLVEFPDSVESLLTKWTTDGTIDTVIQTALIDEKLEPVNVKLADTATNVTNLKKLVRLDSQPDAGSIFGGFNSLPLDAGYPDRVIAKWDALMAKFPNIITKTNLGKDTSQTYDIFKYEFTPPNYETTIIVNAGIHGPEREGMRGLLRLMQLIYEESDKYPQLKYLRHNVRIITVPLQNPWGLANNSRNNSENRDLNRFFTNDSMTREIVYIKNIIDSLKNESHLFIDIHNTEVRDSSNEYYCAFPRFSKYDNNVISDIIGELSPEPAKFTFDKVQNNTCIEYAAKRGYNSVSMEWVPGAFDTQQSSADVTQMCEFFANVVLQLSLKNKLSFNVAEQKNIFVNGNFTATPYTTTNVWTEIEPLRQTIRPLFSGLFDIHGVFNFTATGTDPTTFLAVTVEQIGNERYDPAIPSSAISLAAQRADTEVFVKNEGGTTRHQLSLLYSGQFFTSNNKNVGDLIIKFWLRSDNGSVGLTRERIVIKLVPAVAQNNFIHKKESAGALIESFPNGVYL